MKNGADVLKLNRDGDAPIHIACEYSRLAILKIILECKTCDPNQKNIMKNTALHIVCRMRTGRELQFLEVLTSTPGINATLVNLDGNAPIHTACMHCRLESLKVLLSCESCDPNQQNLKGDTALHIVCRMSKLQFFEMLTSTPGINPTLVNHERIAPFDVVDSDGNTILHNACAKGNTTMVELLMKNEADVLRLNGCGDAPIHIACIHSQLNTMKVLWSYKRCNVNQQNSKGDTALHIVCRMRTGRELQFLEVLTSIPGINPILVNHEGIAPFDVVGTDDNTLLHIACAKGNSTAVEFLVKNGADVLKLNRDGDAPIHIACEYSRLAILKIILECKTCDPNQKNIMKNTALHIVCRMRTGRELQFLEVLTFTPGINATLVNLDGNAPIHTACMHCRLESLKVLLSCESCDPNQQNLKGDTALHIVCRMSKLQFFEMLTSTPGINPTLVNHERIAPFDVVDSDGNTILHNACAKGNTTMVELLMKNEADVLRLNGCGDAPIHIACIHSQLNTMKVLWSYKRCDVNQQNSKGDTALHIVCRMRTGRELQFLEVLTSTPELNYTVMNHEGDAPIHAACECSRLDTLKVLLDCERCDVNQQNAVGNTALHIVCGMKTESTFLGPLLSTPGINPTLVNHEGNAPIHTACINSRLESLKGLLSCESCDPNQRNSKGDTALHIVCRMRTGRELRFLEVLTSTPELNYTIMNHEGDAPIHAACECLRLDTLKVLLGCERCDVNQQNAVGNTALHIVCGMRTDSIFLEPLLSTPGINPEIVNYIGCTAIEVEGTNYSAIDAINKFLEHKKSSIQAYLKIFVVGNSGTGKSTLIKAVTTEASQLRKWLKYSPLSKMKYVNSSDVPPLTAGIVPIPFNSKHFGNAVLYDFAGQHEYYSSHAAVMENLILPSPPLFLLLIDISKSKEVVKEELIYWWHFINNQSQKAAKPPHVILAGSHKDMVKSRDREKLEIMIRDSIKRLPVTFEFVGYFPLDCRKLVSRGLSALLTQLNVTCQVLRQNVDIKLHCHILYSLLMAPEFQDSVYCKAVDIISKIEFNEVPLPQTSSQLVPLLASLNDQGHILLLQNHTDESKSWVILKPDVLLTEVNGSVFAPKGFKEQFNFAMSTGVVTLSKLKEKFTEYNVEVIAAYLTHLEFCFRIKDQHTLDMITKYEIHESATTEEYYFFPALVSVENPTDD